MLLENITTIFSRNHDDMLLLKCTQCGGATHQCTLSHFLSTIDEELIPKHCTTNKDQEVTAYCNTCEKFICVTCFEEEHMKHIIRLEDQFYCYEHADMDSDVENPCTFYCETHKTPLCETCKAAHGDPCVTVSISEFIEEKKAFLANYLPSPGESVIKSYEERLADTEQTLHRIEPLIKEVQELPGKIRSQKDNLKNNLDHNKGMIKACSERVKKYLSYKSYIKQELKDPELSEDGNWSKLSEELKNVEESLVRVEKYYKLIMKNEIEGKFILTHLDDLK
jgi:hypothetical protein